MRRADFSFGFVSRTKQPAAEALKRVRSWGRLTHLLPSQLSGGRNRRGHRAGLINHSLKTYLADEPTGNLDEATNKSSLIFFRDLQQIRPTTELMGHSYPYIARQADRRSSLQQRPAFLDTGLCAVQLGPNSSRWPSAADTADCCTPLLCG